MNLNAFSQWNASPIISFEHVLQPCLVGTISDSIRNTNAAMLFGGWKRELMFNMKLLRQWTKLYMSEHGAACSVNEQISLTQYAFPYS
jgi:hypothetical protein